MESLIQGFRHLRCQRLVTSGQLWKQTRATGANQAIRCLASEANVVVSSQLPATVDDTSDIRLPFDGVKHARRVPDSPSYFSREPRFNDLFVRLTTLLTKHHELPVVENKDAVSKPWLKLPDLRAHFGEQVKAHHYAKALRLARRLNKIEASVRPAEIDVVLSDLTRAINANKKRPNPLTIDRYGRAVGVGKRKESTARAFVVEGTGEILINGKTLSDAFGRTHDRESAVWALTSTERLDKYNVWALVEGGGTTGQAEAMTMAIAKALVAHEPGLKPTLRKAGCITRDFRTVERKKHGHLKARKSPAWVKR